MKRYYCDFCDRSYSYSVEAFRKHRNGHQHQKLRRAHYDQFKTAREKVEEETRREKCRRFFSGQVCAFGDSCVFSHVTPAGFQALHQQAQEEEEEERKRKLPTAVRQGQDVSIEAWLKQQESHPVLPSLVPDALPGPSSTPQDPVTPLTTGPVPFPTQLYSLPHLPLSLVPPTVESLMGVEFAKWG